MKVKVYIANAFSEEKFGGNPAAVVPLDEWLADKLMQQIAAQNNLAETAFIIPQGKDYAIRWFTPVCGSRSLWSCNAGFSHVLFKHLGYTGEQIIFHSKSGHLLVNRRKDGKITLDFPADEPEKMTDDGLIEKALGIKPMRCL